MDDGSGTTGPGDMARAFHQGQDLILEGPEGAHHVEPVFLPLMIMMRRPHPPLSTAGSPPLLHHRGSVAGRRLLSGFRVGVRQSLAVEDCGAFFSEQLGDGRVHPLRRGGAPRLLVGYFHEACLL